ncbi:uncharacterized protein [Epargyreus clarus]|uniref:uncharacterized protein n=1 Tax=Epargyreus clarus TaxID=520877 RepID=UPI003C2AF8F2
MEPDSTTYESTSSGKSSDEIYVPFTTCPGNFNFFKELVTNNGKKSLVCQIIQRLQDFGLLATSVRCPSGQPDCNVVCRQARVIDRVQWVCEGCGKRQPIRIGSFFYRLQCSILQTLQLILAWCEDADLNYAVQHFDVKPKVANCIFEKLDDLAIRELRRDKLGGENAVVLAEMYPDCLNRLSPDTTDQPHVHRILMLADTKHIPTNYRFHVIREDSKLLGFGGETYFLKTQVEEAVSSLVEPGSVVVTGNSVPSVEGTWSLQQLQQYCDVDMQHFLSSRIWSQAVVLCGASRELCAGATGGACALHAQRYLHAALYRLRTAGDGFFRHVLTLIAAEFTCSDEKIASVVTSD